MLTREEPVYGWSNLIANPTYEADYRPRYYSFDDGQSVPIHNKGGHFDPVSGSWVGDPPSMSDWSGDDLTIADPADATDPVLFDESGASIASVLPVSPTSDWISAEMLRQTIVDELDHKALEDDRTFKVDATLHTVNSVVGFVPGDSTTHGTTAAFTNGRARINGSIIAGQVGLHATHELTLNYDGRASESMSVETEGVQIRRHFSSPTQQ